MALRMDRARETAPIVLNLIKDTGWCYTLGIVSIVAFIPVFTFQCYEAWRVRKEGAHQVMVNLTGAVAVAANATWMIGDVFYHDQFRPIVKWIFNIGWVLIGIYGLFAWRASRKKKLTPPTEQPVRTMMISQEGRGIIFVHSTRKLEHLHRPMSPRQYHTLMVQRRHNHLRNRQD